MNTEPEQSYPIIDCSTRKFFKENPNDLETFFEGLTIASDADFEFPFLDFVMSSLRENPNANIADLTFKGLKKYDLIGFERRV